MKKKFLIMAVFLIMSHTSYGAEKVSMGYLYFPNPDNYISTIESTNGNLNMVSPSYFDIDVNGDLIITNKLQTSFIQDMHNKGIKVIPFLSNHWDRNIGIKALENREQLSTDIAHAIITYNLDGVNVDIENVKETERYAYADLVCLINEKLPEDKLVTTAVAANPKGWKTGWHGSYDYQRLVDYSDFLVIMAYDESWYGSVPGPVASLEFVENSIIYALNQGVPSDKIVLGIPFYGRYWNSSQSVGGSGISMKQVQTLVDLYNGYIVYDTNYQTPRATFTITSSSPPAYTFGQLLKTGNYTIWYENDQSINAKLQLIYKYNLAGSANWSLGHEPSSIWDSYGTYLSGVFYSDVSNHWALEDILLMSELAWMNGKSETIFAPNHNLTRAEAATVFSRVLNLDKASVPSHFNDVDNSHWALEYINAVNEQGLFIGDSNGNFKPDEPLSRAEIAVVIDRIYEQIDATDTKTFSDVTEEHWSYEAISRMGAIDIIQGYPDGTFKPAQSIRRGEMATLSTRIYYKGIN